MPHFFAYLDRMKYIQRWNIMRNMREENIQEHSLQVAILAHALAVIKNHYYGGQVNPERAAVLAIFHEASEVITGDMATPVKYFSPEFRHAYRELEDMANDRLMQLLPSELHPQYASLLSAAEKDHEEHRLVKMADTLSAYLKCIEELKSGNSEFSSAHDSILARIEEDPAPELQHFLREYVPSYRLNLDELNRPNS